MTIVDLKNILRDFYANYLIQNTFYFGDVFEFVQKKDIIYPAVIFDLQALETQAGGSVYTFDVYFVDLYDVHNKDNNYIDIIAECERICYDTIAYLRSNRIITHDDAISSIPIKDTLNDDNIAGIKISLKISLENSINLCAIPTNSMPSPLLNEDGGVILLE